MTLRQKRPMGKSCRIVRRSLLSAVSKRATRAALMMMTPSLDYSGLFLPIYSSIRFACLSR